MSLDSLIGWAHRGAVPIDRRRSQERLQTVVDMIRDSTEYVVLASYLLGEGAVIDALEEAASRGRRCYILTAAEEQLRLDRTRLTPEDREVIERHRLLLDRCQEFALIRSGSGFHAKALLVDGPEGRAVLSTSNMRDGALVGNDEFVIDLQKDEVSELFALLRWAMFVAAENEMTGQGRIVEVANRNDVILPSDGHLLSRTMHGDGISSYVAARVRAARGSVVVASYSWSSDHPVVKAMTDLARRGGDVTALVNLSARSSLPTIRDLSNAGVSVLGRRWLHAKAVAVDDEAIVCTSNFRQETLVSSSLDIGIVTDGARAADIATRLKEWAESATHEFVPPKIIETAAISG